MWQFSKKSPFFFKTLFNGWGEGTRWASFPKLDEYIDYIEQTVSSMSRFGALGLSRAEFFRSFKGD